MTSFVNMISYELSQVISAHFVVRFFLMPTSYQSNIEIETAFCENAPIFIAGRFL